MRCTVTYLDSSEVICSRSVLISLKATCRGHDRFRLPRPRYRHRRRRQARLRQGIGVQKGGEPVDTRTVFQISSVTKGFLATTLAIAVDRGKFRWELWP